jgi:hypothetical protein
MAQAVAAINSSWVEAIWLRQHWFCHCQTPSKWETLRLPIGSWRREQEYVMAVFQRIALGCALALASLAQADFANAASDARKLITPPRTNTVICDSRGCFGFGQRQFYTRPGQPLPTTPPYTGGLNRYDSPRVYMLPRETYAPRPRALYPSPNQKLRQHQTWCAVRYRTYNPGTNRYTTINNGTKPCRSPFD